MDVGGLSRLSSWEQGESAISSGWILGNWVIYEGQSGCTGPGRTLYLMLTVRPSKIVVFMDYQFYNLNNRSLLHHFFFLHHFNVSFIEAFWPNFDTETNLILLTLIQ